MSKQKPRQGQEKWKNISKKEKLLICRRIVMAWLHTNISNNLSSYKACHSYLMKSKLFKLLLDMTSKWFCRKQILCSYYCWQSDTLEIRSGFGNRMFSECSIWRCVISMFFSFRRTYHSFWRSSQDFIRNSEAFQLRPSNWHNKEKGNSKLSREVVFKL